LVGSSNEANVTIDGIATQALLDTGSTVSTVSRGFYDKHLSSHAIQSLDVILDIECADGQALPYEGYVEADIAVAGLPSSDTQTCLLLVVPDSRYSSDVPLLLGTNIMSHFMLGCKQQYGERFLQTADLHTPWYLAFRCMTLRDRQLAKTNYCLGVVKSAEQKSVVVPPNSQVVVAGYVTGEVQYPTTCALLQPTKGSAIPDDIDISPTIISYEYGKNGLVDVHISNVTTRTVVIPPKAMICEIQPVTIEHTTAKGETGDDSNTPSFLDDLDIDVSSLDVDQHRRLTEIIIKFSDIFSQSDTDIGHTTAVHHKVNLADDIPFKQRTRRIPPGMFDDVRSHLQQLLSAGVIRPSHSPWSSNVVLVKKKDGSLRMCIDYRQLNQNTVKDSYALPRIEEILDALGGNSYFTVLDMKSGYHQVEMDEQHKQRTAFTVGPLGFFEYNRMPFGLVNAPATYQRLMEECLGDLHTTICFIYLDDLIIFSKTYEEHLERLEMVFERLRQHNLKLSPKKCSFIKRRVKYVGHIVSENGVEADPDKIDKVVNWPTPTSPEDVRKFLGFAGYYRKYVKDFAKISKPLSELMPVHSHSKAGKRKQSDPLVWNWGIEQEEAFVKLKELLGSPPILGFADYATPFELHTDASQRGLGAVLYQKQGGKLRVISYASRGLSKTEKNYSAHKLEFLALKWSVTEKFHDYLYGNKFVVFTDNNPLTYILTTAKLDATGHRWLAALSAYDFEIHYRPGKKNTDADILSRLPDSGSESEDETLPKLPVATEQDIRPRQHVSIECIQAVCNSVHARPYVESLCFSAQAIDSDDFSGQTLARFTDRDWRLAQSRDPDLQIWIKHVNNCQRPSKQQIPASPAHLTLLRTFDHLQLVRGILHRETTIDGEKQLQVVLPSALINQVLSGLHNDIGHPGRDRTMSLLRDRFFWPGMSKDADEWIKNCDRCLRRKAATNIRAPLVNITTSQPLELVCMDFLSLETSKGGFNSILVITDHFTRYAQAIPTRNQTARTTAEAFMKHFVEHYGLPKRIHSDQGANFGSKLVKELCSLTGMVKSRTTPYHPTGNGMCERFNRTLLNMLGTLEPKEKLDWKSHVGPLVHAYNSIRHDSTGQSPFSLMFGRQPRLPIDLAFGIDLNKNQPQSKYVSSLRDRLIKSYELVSSVARDAHARQKKGYDTKVRGATVQSGDRVLVRTLAFDGKHKIADRWEEEAYIVLAQPNSDIPVFVVQKENGHGRKRTLHRNLLLPIGALPETPVQHTPAPRCTRPVPKPRPRRKSVASESESVSHIDTMSEMSDDYIGILPLISVGETENSTPQSAGNSLAPDADAEPQLSDDDQEVGGLAGSVLDEDAHPSTDEEQESVNQDDESVVEDIVSDEEESAQDTSKITNSASSDADIEDETEVEILATGDIASPNVHIEDEEKPEEETSGDEVGTPMVHEAESAPERPRRRAKQPAWMTSGQYTMSAITHHDWKDRVALLQTLIASGNLCPSSRDKAFEAMLSLVTGQGSSA
jgi:transposase InsO family protein